MKRFGAALAAAAMVVLAIVARGALDDSDDADRRGDGETMATTPGIVCAEDLADICAEAGVPTARTERAGATADLLIAADSADALDGRAWLVTGAWASMVVDERARLGQDPLFEVVGSPLAAITVTVAVWSDRYEQLAARCGIPSGDELGWRCLAEESGAALDGGDRVAVAMPDVDTAAGLVVAAAQAAGLLGRTDYASNDFDGSFRSLAARLSRGQTGEPLRTMRSRGPGQVTAAATTGADAVQLSSTFGTIRPGTPAPEVRAEVVLVAPTGTEVSDADQGALVAALLAAGWTSDGSGPSGLPAGGVLAAIRTLWNENR